MRRHNRAPHIKRLGKSTQMKPACATEANQGEIFGIIAALDGNHAQRLRHPLVRNLKDALCGFIDGQ